LSPSGNWVELNQKLNLTVTFPVAFLYQWKVNKVNTILDL
jgi:hypothetical protein